MLCYSITLYHTMLFYTIPISPRCWWLGSIRFHQLDAIRKSVPDTSCHSCGTTTTCADHHSEPGVFIAEPGEGMETICPPIPSIDAIHSEKVWAYSRQHYTFRPCQVLLVSGKGWGCSTHPVQCLSDCETVAGRSCSGSASSYACLFELSVDCNDPRCCKWKCLRYIVTIWHR